MRRTLTGSQLRRTKRAVFKTAPAVFLDGHPLTPADTKRLFDAYDLWFEVWCDVSKTVIEHYALSPGHWYSRSSSYAALISKLRQLVRTDLSVVNTDLKAALQALRHLSDNERSTFGPWDRRGKTKVSRSGLVGYVEAYGVSPSGVVWSILQPTFYLLWLFDDHEVFRQLNTMIQFIQRLTLRDVDWIEQENIDTYKAFEEDAKTWVYDPMVVQEVSSVIEHWFRDWNESDPHADHGYGATFEVRRSAGTAKKYWNGMLPIQTVESALLAARLNWRPDNQLAWPGLTGGFDQQIVSWLQDEPCNSTSQLTGKVQLVPKGIDKKRVVSMEPTVNQFFQKQIGGLFDKHFTKHPEMRIALHNQEFNRRLTLLGSANREFGTIDLSSASDSVTWTLVREVFKGTKVLPLLEWSRTTKVVLPDDSVVTLEKFSPMGSAVCFPVECTVFSAIVQVAMRHMGVNRYYRVYGDDLVVHRDVFDEVVKLLKQLHFKVNEDKSFKPELPFKESCGIECYNGFDVSPVRLSRKWDVVKQRQFSELLRAGQLSKAGSRKRKTTKVEPQLEALYELGNQCYMSGFFQTRKRIIERTLGMYPGVVFSHNCEHGFFTPATNLFNENCKVRPIRRYGSLDRLDHTIGDGLEIRMLVTASYIESGDDVTRYSKLLEEYSQSRRHQLYSFEDRIDCFSGAAVTTAKWRWFPVAELDRWSCTISDPYSDAVLSSAPVKERVCCDDGIYTI